MDNFIARGISKEKGKFCFGYYIFVENNHYLVSTKCKPTLDGLVCYYSWDGIEKDYTEITQVPDRWTECHDKNEKKIWERDICNVWIEGYKQDKPYTIHSSVYINEQFNISDKYLCWTDCEVTGNTHGIIT